MVTWIRVVAIETEVEGSQDIFLRYRCEERW